MSKTCRTCRKGEMQVREETYLYAESGLPNVVLVGVQVRRCPECGAHELVLPRVTELHRTIALALIPRASAAASSLSQFAGERLTERVTLRGVGPHGRPAPGRLPPLVGLGVMLLELLFRQTRDG